MTAMPVLICDDSSMARKLMARSLPDGWDVDLAYASNGKEAVAALAERPAEVLLLDLTMPVMDGFQVLQWIRANAPSLTTVVVSGDIQPEARRRVIALGAAGFLRKPIDAGELRETLDAAGVLSSGAGPEVSTGGVRADVAFMDVCREVANIAMGQAAERLARLLGVFIVMPVPNVNTLEASELRMALAATRERDSITAVCQGIVGSGIAGEAMLLFHDSSFAAIAEIMGYRGEIDTAMELELVMDTANVLIGAFLSGIADQLDTGFSQGHPTVLGRHTSIDRLLDDNATHWRRTLAIEINYRVEQHEITCDLLLLIPEESMPTLRSKLAYLQ